MALHYKLRVHRQFAHHGASAEKTDVSLSYRSHTNLKKYIVEYTLLLRLPLRTRQHVLKLRMEPPALRHELRERAVDLEPL